VIRPPAHGEKIQPALSLAITFDLVERYNAAKLAESDPLCASSINKTEKSGDSGESARGPDIGICVELTGVKALCLNQMADRRCAGRRRHPSRRPSDPRDLAFGLVALYFGVDVLPASDSHPTAHRGRGQQSSPAQRSGDLEAMGSHRRVRAVG
jgi:hypothetical protein